MSFEFNPINTIETLPRKTIMMWYGTVATIPSGWLFCNGSNGTPDLRNRMIAGADTDNGTQPTTNIAVTIYGGDQIQGGTADHNHIMYGTVTSPLDAGTDVESPISNPINVASNGHTHAFDSVTSGVYDLPVPYFALLFIMKS